MRRVAVLGVGLMALSACSTATTRPAPSTSLTEVSACEKVLEAPCTLPNGGRPFRRVAFPDIKDWSSLKISLERTACDFDCPGYTVTVRGEGTVSWHGEHNVRTKGRAVAHIAPEKVRALFEAFRKAEFFWLFDKYAAIEVAGPPNQLRPSPSTAIPKPCAITPVT